MDKQKTAQIRITLCPILSDKNEPLRRSKIMTNSRTIVLCILGLGYLAYTLTFAIKFNRDKGHFSKKQLLIHNILIWTVPIFWIFLIQTFLRPTLGSHRQRKNKIKGTYYESGHSFWADSDNGA